MSSYENFVTDDIIKRRLLFDGDGAGDDRKLLGLTKSFINFCNNVGEGGESREEIKSTLLSLLSQLNQIEFSAKRTHQAIIVNEGAKDTYHELKATTLDEIQQTRELIVKSKTLLEEAIKFRKHAMEYDALAKLIETKPDRKQTEARQKELQLELEQLKKRREEANDKLESRKNKFQVLTHAISMLQETLEDDDVVVEKAPESTPKTDENAEPISMEIDGPSSECTTVASSTSGGSRQRRIDDKSQNYEDLSDEGETAS